MATPARICVAFIASDGWSRRVASLVAGLPGLHHYKLVVAVSSSPPSSMSRALALVDSSDESRKHESASTATQILETKLYAPRSRSGLVARPRLIDALRHGAALKLTLVV